MNILIRAVVTVLAVLVSSWAYAADIHIVDGDTLAIGDQRFRLHGIDAPEAGQKCNTPSGKLWRCGDEATAHLIALTQGKPITCDDRGLDDYDRTLSVCKAGDVELNAAMVRDGYAWAFVKFSNDYVKIERMAKLASAGVWQADTEPAWVFRAHKWEVAVQEAPEGCPIKGNISKNGHIYHPPWSPWYARTKVSLNKGERWFCSEREALDAGWRAPIWGN